MNIQFKRSALAISLLSVFSGYTLAAQHQGEDGLVYQLDQQTKQHGLRSSSVKLSKAVREAAKTQEQVDVIVFLQPQFSAKALQVIDAEHQPLLNDLREKLVAIENKYKPSESLSEQEEVEFLRSDAAKVSAQDKALSRQIKQELDTMRDQLRLKKAQLIQQNNVGLYSQLESMLVGAGAKVTNRIELSHALSAQVPANILAQLAANPNVRAVELDRPADLELNVSVPSSKFTSWAPDYDGFPYDFGVVDTGVRENHPAFNASFCSKPGSAVSGDHGTHVTGIVASENGTYKGTAPGVDQVIWANSGNQSTTMANMQWMITGSCQGPEVVNHSLGYGVADDTDYSNTDAFYDAFVQNYNVMVTKSTGNSGWHDSSPRITHPAPAYNLMAVANMDDKNTTSRGDDVRRSSSSVGPTLSNRKKPDITAPGTAIMSTNSDWATEADFISKSGTSMAAPHVAGAIILLEDGGNHTPMAQKAVLLNTADAWTSNNTSGTGDDAQVFGSHWDKSYGWGYIDMWEAKFNRADYFVSSVVPRNNNAIANDYKLFKGKMYSNEKATLVWQRRANFSSGPTGSAYNLSDLNLRLYNEGSNSLVDSDFDGNDNVHQVAANSTMDAVIKVYAWSSSFDNATSESFALATEENFSAVAPPALQVPNQSFSAPANTSRVINISVKNNGGVDTCSVKVTRQGVSGVSGTTSASIAKIADAGSATAAFKLSAVKGYYSIPIRATTTCYNETYTVNGTIKLYAY
ncbi:S8 family serine peptidase [Aliikangiella sp. IMCC44632]